VKPEQAVRECISSMERGRFSSRQMRAVTQCVRVDVTPFEVFLGSHNDFIKSGAIKIIGEKGTKENLSALITLAAKETDRRMLMQIIDVFIKRSDDVGELVNLLESDDQMVFENAIDMFRRVGRADCLFGLVFSRDRELVERIKRYINEHRETPGS